MAKKKADVQVRVEGSASVSMGAKSVSIAGNSLIMTNEFGNSVSYGIGIDSFDALWSDLWQFVKDSQH